MGLSKTPNEQLKVSSGEYVIKDPIVIQFCNVYDLNRHLLYDSGKKYCVENFTVKASFIRCNQSNTIVYFNKGSFINITFKESTLCSTVQNGSYFAQVMVTDLTRLLDIQMELLIFIIVQYTILLIAKTLLIGIAIEDKHA